MVMRFISLFSGAGGFDLGFERAGMQCVAQVEWDKYCQQVLQHHWPHIPKWHDICDVDGADLPDAEVVIFGSPCQDLSVAGNRDGIVDGQKSSMFFEAMRVIQEKQNATGTVRYLVWENVAGALSSNSGEDFGIVLDTLAQHGIVDIQWRVLNAKHFGVPQHRRRLFVIAQFDSAEAHRSGRKVLPVPQISTRDSQTSKQDGIHLESNVAPSTTNTRESNTHRQPIAFGYNQTRSIQESLKVFPTLRYSTPSQGVLQHNDEQAQLRILSPLECERLMGWDDNHTAIGADRKPISDAQRFKMCGNGVVAPVAQWLANQIIKAETNV
jgi:DNA (cytosine-5)-methyltransferase 1